jgi:uncharacterized protein with GYD domain
MTVYVLLVKLTEKGKANLKGSFEKRESIMDWVQKNGGKNLHVFTTFGRYDVIEIMDLPSDDVALKLSIKAAETGDANIETLRGFTQEEMKKIQDTL